MSEAKPIIVTNNLTKQYGELTAVNNVNLTIMEGEIFSMLGVNGAGKTTTIKMLSCLTEPTSGDAEIYGLSIKKDQQQIKQILNVSPQETAVAQKLSVYENIEFIAEIYEIDKATRKQRIDQIIKDFQLEAVKNKKAQQLSGGMQRRLSIAMAIISNPKILFLDEPSLGLDVLARRELWAIIKSLKNITIMLTTHYMEEAEYLSDRIGIMYNGKLIDVDNTKHLIEKTNSKSLEDAFVKIIDNEVQR